MASAVVALVGVGAAVVAPAVDASYPGRNGEIVFTPGWAMDPNGGHRRPVMRDRDNPYGGFRADGRRYVFSSCRNDRCGLYVMDADGGHVRHVPGSPKDAALPRFGPDGKRIVYELDAEVFIVGVDGRHRRSLGPGREPVFSPNGEWIACDGADGHMRLVRPDGSRRHRVTYGSKYELAPSFSPDGERIAFLAPSGSGWDEVYVMDVDGDDVRQVTNYRGALTGPVFSPDGRKIVFGHYPGREETVNWDVYVVRVDGTHARRLTRGPSADIPADWQPLP